MTAFRFLALCSALALIGPPAVSEVPAASGKRADPQKVARLYAGKTDLWGGDCGGGIYFSPDMQARAWCAASSTAFGAGRWSVDSQGRLCHTLRWYWPDEGTPGAGKAERSCVEHAVDGRGRIWRRWPGDPEWWRMTNTQRPVSGYKFSRQVSAARAAAGL